MKVLMALMIVKFYSILQCFHFQTIDSVCSFTEEDEEALIDRLASLAAAVGSNPKNYQPQNYDLSQLGYPDLNDDAGFSRDSVLKLPRQFGYKPNDLRFYLPADQFPLYPSQGAEELQQQLEQQQNVNYEVPPPQNQQQRLPLSIPVNSNPSPVTSPQGQNQNVQRHVGGGQPEVMADGQSDFYFMKKKEQANQGPHDSPIRSYVPGPSHVMSSGHSANYPGFTSSPVDEKQFTYSDMYYIGMQQNHLNKLRQFQRLTWLIIFIVEKYSHHCRLQRRRCCWTCSCRSVLVQVRASLISCLSTYFHLYAKLYFQFPLRAMMSVKTFHSFHLLFCSPIRLKKHAVIWHECKLRTMSQKLLPIDKMEIEWVIKFFLISPPFSLYRIHERIKAAADVDYPAYGVTGMRKNPFPSLLPQFVKAKNTQDLI